MSDYAKTVKLLRYCSKATVKDCMECEGYKETGDCVSQKLAKEAADAIEELTAQVRDKDYLIQQQTEEIQRLQRDVKKQQKKMIELAKALTKRGGWVRSDELLPDNMESDWVIAVVNGSSGTSMKYTNAVIMASYDPATGWFLDEDPYAEITVEYWMPLPEPPKEDE